MSTLTRKHTNYDVYSLRISDFYTCMESIMGGELSYIIDTAQGEGGFHACVKNLL